MSTPALQAATHLRTLARAFDCMIGVDVDQRTVTLARVSDDDECLDFVTLHCADKADTQAAFAEVVRAWE